MREAIRAQTERLRPFVKWAGFGAIVMFALFFLYKVANPQPAVARTTASGWTVPPIIDSVFIMAFGIAFSLNAAYIGANAWIRTGEEYIEYLEEWLGRSKFRDALMAISRSYPVWNDRFLSIFGFIFGLAIGGYGGISLFLNFV